MWEFLCISVQRITCPEPSSPPPSLPHPVVLLLNCCLVFYFWNKLTNDKVVSLWCLHESSISCVYSFLCKILKNYDDDIYKMAPVVNFFSLLKLLGDAGEVYRFQTHNSTTHHQYTLYYICTSPSQVFPSPFIPPLTLPNHHTVICVHGFFSSQPLHPAPPQNPLPWFKSV